MVELQGACMVWATESRDSGRGWGVAPIGSSDILLPKTFSADMAVIQIVILLNLEEA